MTLHRWNRIAVRAAAAAWVVGILAMPSATRAGDEPGLLGRLRLGRGATAGTSPSPRSGPVARTRAATPGTVPDSLEVVPPPAATDAADPVVIPPDDAPAGPTARITPQPREARPWTQADPLLTRMTIGQSNEGTRFGMFLHIYTDGTVVSSEGVFRAEPSALKALTDVLNRVDVNRKRTFCGSPATDYVEQVQIVAYERSLGRLRANAFGYSGNMQGCDPQLRQLQTALDTFQARLTGAAGPEPSTDAAPAADAAPKVEDTPKVEPAPIPLTVNPAPPAPTIPVAPTGGPAPIPLTRESPE